MNISRKIPFRFYYISDFFFRFMPYGIPPRRCQGCFFPGVGGKRDGGDDQKRIGEYIASEAEKAHARDVAARHYAWSA